MTNSEDPFDLGRFVAAQEAAGTYQRALSELRLGRKTGHWMWFVLPQVGGLGKSAISSHFAVSSLAEAVAYVDHPLLGPRLVECAEILARMRGRSADEIFGLVDAMKLRSSMTLFLRAAPQEKVFSQVLDRYFDGRPDPETDRRI
ncbi:MAG: DUF1810 domain-containing protein [Candidatus Dormiibacterota bacterium]